MTEVDVWVTTSITILLEAEVRVEIEFSLSRRISAFSNNFSAILRNSNVNGVIILILVMLRRAKLTKVLNSMKLYNPDD